MASFEVISSEHFWNTEIDKIVNCRKTITKRTFSQKEGLLSIRYDFSDNSYVIVPLQILESFIKVFQKDETTP